MAMMVGKGVRRKAQGLGVLVVVLPSTVDRLPSHRPSSAVQFGNGFELDHDAIFNKKSARRLPICCLRQKKGLFIQ